jgi:hypothetical protein
MPGSFSATPILDGLKQFQRSTVDHVIDRFYGADPSRKFLVADETGLGKSMVARGVIARVIEQLRDDDAVERIDVIYVCSNADIAEQNLKRLDILGQGAQQQSTRLTLLAAATGDLNGEPDPTVGKRVNLISFTPGTSFDLGDNAGRVDERALLFIILTQHLGYASKSSQRAASLVLQGWVSIETFDRNVRTMSERLDDTNGPDRTIVDAFIGDIRRQRLLKQFERAVDDLGLRRVLRDYERRTFTPLIGALRSSLARAGVEALEPDLVILDEFQRFRHLLAIDDPKFREAAELAHALFDHGDARVLLLSATPYKPFTYAEEAVQGDDHEKDLRRTLDFLAGGNGGGDTVERIVSMLGNFRQAAIDGQDTAALCLDIRHRLIKLMCRTERPRLGDDGMLREHAEPADDLVADDLVSYARMRELARAIDAPMAVDYWKSTPYFVNFCDGYKFGDQLREALDDPDERHRLRPLVRGVQHLDHHAVHELAPLEPGNARLRELADQTVERGLWKLLWLPPSLPYQPLDGPFAEPAVAGATKRLIFSSWAAAPSAIASLLSHEAIRQLAGGDRSKWDAATATRRLDWRAEGGRPGAMTTLALFWPTPALARGSDPLNPVPIATEAQRSGAEPWYWRSLFAAQGSVPDDLQTLEATQALSGELDASDVDAEHSRLGLHVELALDLAHSTSSTEAATRTDAPSDLDETIAAIGAYAPGNVALRCIDRLTTGSTTVTELGRWRAAAVIASGIRSLFSRAESMLLLDQLLPDAVYWRAVLQYCAWGNLEAVLDEYLHHLSEADRQKGLTDESLVNIAERVRTAMTLRPAAYSAFDPTAPSRPLRFPPARFALRYGNKRASADEDLRQPDIRSAFNSPFWPFVLATTSIGQEGIDLHWWCHAAVHWNTPASPVDFEQREGRVHRYGGHAIRKNLAADHGDGMREELSNERHPWDVAYERGAAARDERYGELVPHWITEGASKVERWVLPYPLSQDLERYQRLKDDLSLYRLTFGQPRQEEMLDLLRRRNQSGRTCTALDLCPPGSGDRGVSQRSP